jgi:hypothetical protein
MLFRMGHQEDYELTRSVANFTTPEGNLLVVSVYMYEMDFEILGRRIKHPVRVLQHVTEDIIGIDFINTHHLWYDPVHR